ncbi:MAG TPA: hypothetical protein VJT33_00120 [bacterium]|nr:hypothetical protein [bacterium]
MSPGTGLCIRLVSGTFFFELILFVAVFLLIRLRHPWRAWVTAWLVAIASILFLASFAFLGVLALGYGCG